MKKKAKTGKKGIYVVIVLGAIVISLAIAAGYYTDQARLSGQKFGNNLEQIQSELKKQTTYYESQIILWQEKNLTKEEILQVSKDHLSKLTEILAKYDILVPPASFAPSLELFRLSTQSQLESDTLFMEWLQTGDNSTKIRSDQLLQQSFDYETSALASFNKAKNSSP